MSLKKNLLLSLIKGIEINKDNLVIALEDLDNNELERFAELLIGSKVKTLKPGDVLYYKRLDREITIINNNFVHDRIDYSFKAIRYAKPGDVDVKYTKYNTDNIQTEEYSIPVEVIDTSWDRYDELFK